jgi:hypothetical protein
VPRDMTTSRAASWAMSGEARAGHGLECPDEERYHRSSRALPWLLTCSFFLSMLSQQTCHITMHVFIRQQKRSHAELMGK